MLFILDAVFGDFLSKCIDLIIEVLYYGTSIAHDILYLVVLSLYGILLLPLQCICRDIHLTAILIHSISNFPSSLLLFLYCSSRIDVCPTVHDIHVTDHMTWRVKTQQTSVS